MSITFLWLRTAGIGCGIMIASCGVAFGDFGDATQAVSKKPLLFASEKHRFVFPTQSRLGASSVQNLTFSADGKKLAAGGSGNVIVWEVRAGKKIGGLDCGKGNGAFSAFSPDGDFLLSEISHSPLNHYVKLWEITTGREVFSHFAYGGRMQFIPDGKQFLCNLGETVIARDAKTGMVLRKFAKSGPLSVSQDGTLVAESLPDSALTIWNLQTEKEVKVLKLAEKVRSFSPSGKMLWSSDQKTKTAWFLSATTGEKLHTIRFSAAPSRVTLSPDDKWLAVSFSSKSDEAGHTVIYDVRSGTEVLKLELAPGRPGALAFNPQGTLLAGSSGDIVQVWELSEAKPLPRAKLTAKFTQTIKTNEESVPRLIGFGPDAKSIIVAGMASKIVAGKTIDKKEVTSWSLKDGKPVWSLQGEEDILTRFVLSKDGETLVEAGKGWLNVLNGKTGKLIRKINRDGPGIGDYSQVVFGRSAKEFAALENDSIQFFSIGPNGSVEITRTMRGAFATKNLHDADLSSDQNRVVVGSPPVVLQIDAQKRISMFAGRKGHISRSSFCPCGKLIASVNSEEYSLCVWEAETGIEKRKFQFPKDSQFCFTFSSDGKWLITGGHQGTGGEIVVWELPTFKKVLTIPSKRAAFAVAISPRADMIAAACYGECHVWTLRKSESP